MAIFRSFFDLIPGEPCTQRHSSGVGSKVYTLLGRTLKINDHTALHQKAHGRANLNSMGTALCAFFCFCFVLLFLFWRHWINSWLVQWPIVQDTGIKNTKSDPCVWGMCSLTSSSLEKTRDFILS